MNNKQIFVGFSGNSAQHQFLDGSLGNKVGVIKRALFLEGSSINASREICRCGTSVHLNLLVSKSGTRDSGRFYLDQCLEKLPAGIQVEELAVLEECHHSLVLHRSGEAQEHEILGFKGRIIDAHVEKVCERIIPAANVADLILLTSVRPAEIPFAKAALSAKKTAVVTLHRELLADVESLRVVLSNVSVVVVNQIEYKALVDKGLDFAKIHALGVKLVVVTNRTSNGLFSHNGFLGDFEVKPIKCESDDGAGDVFTGALTAYLSEQDEALSDVKICKQMLNFAALRTRKALLEKTTIMPIA